MESPPTDPPGVAPSQAVTRATGASAFLTATTVSAGGALGLDTAPITGTHEALIRPGFALTAACAGLSLLLLERGWFLREGVRERASAGAAVLVCLTVAGRSLAGDGFDGAALGGLLVGLSLLLARARGVHYHPLSQIVAGLGLALATTVLVGAALGAASLTALFRAPTPVAALEAALVMVLCAGCLWQRPRLGVAGLLADAGFVGTLLRFMLPVVAGVPFVVGFAVARGLSVHLLSGELAVALTVIGSVFGGVLVVGVSIAMLRSTERALVIRDRALATTTSGVLVARGKDGDGAIVFANEAARTLCGLRADEGLPDLLARLGSGGDPDGVAGPLAPDAAGGADLRIPGESAEDRWVSVNLTPVRSADGSVGHVIAIFEDVTERHRQEARVVAALETAREATAARDDFVRMVGHELRTPMNAALTWIRLAELEQSEETIASALDVVETSIASQARLLDDLSDIAGMSDEGIQIEVEPARMDHLVEETVAELSAEHEVRLAIAPGAYGVDVDPLRIRQVVRNLVGNAIRYSPADAPVDVSLGHRDDRMVVGVRDRGRGMDRQTLERAFEPFWRGEARGAGLGIGLALAAALVRAHGGRITATSAGPGAGSCFTVDLPRSASAAAIAPLDDLVDGPD